MNKYLYFLTKIYEKVGYYTENILQEDYK